MTAQGWLELQEVVCEGLLHLSVEWRVVSLSLGLRLQLPAAMHCCQVEVPCSEQLLWCSPWRGPWPDQQAAPSLLIHLVRLLPQRVSADWNWSLVP